MNERETSEAINEDAIRWVARIDRDPGARSDLDHWLAGDSRRRGAFFRAETAWRMLDRTRGLGALPNRSISENHGEREAPPPPAVSRRSVITGGTALATGLAAGGAFLLWPAAPLRIDTEVGEIRRVPLADGSMAEINTQSRVAIDLRPEVRQIKLAQGEAWFQVAHDKKRPFVVEAGDLRVRAVGTAFSVRRLDEGSTVQVTEGIVEIWRAGQEDARARIAAGSQAFLDEARSADPPSIEMAAQEIDRKLAWRSGQIIFDGDTLGEAAAEFNRYNKVMVRIADPVLASERLVGRFRTNEPDAFAKAVEMTLGASAKISDAEIVLTRG